MKVFEAANIRNVALVGHSGSGKTQLASALLFDGGAVNRFGKVDEGTTVTDYDEEAIARKHTLSASLAFFEWNKSKINLIDTPGMGNFLSDARAALRVVEAAVVVVDAVSGVQVSTEKTWEAADELGLDGAFVRCGRQRLCPWQQGQRLQRLRADVEPDVLRDAGHSSRVLREPRALSPGDLLLGRRLDAVHVSAP